MKNLLLLLFILCVALPSFGQRQVIDKVVATIGGELILLSDVEEQHALAKDQSGGNLPEDIHCQILSSLLVSNLLLNQSKLDSIEVGDVEVESQLNARIEQILEYMGGNIQQFEDYYGQPISSVKDRFREDLRNKLLTERMQAQVMSNITVTPAEVKAFYAKIPVDSLPYFNSEVEVGEIVHKPEVNPEEKQKSIDKLTELRKRIVEDGESFQELAKLHSDDGSSQVGGDLGWAKRGKFVPAFEAAAYKLKAGEISPVFKSEFGYHIIQMIERRGNRIHARHILKRPEITDADIELARLHMDTVRHLIQTDSISFSQAVKSYSSDKTQSFNNDGRMINPSTGNTFFEIGDLDPDVYFALDTLEIGAVSAPFEFTLPPSDSYFRIIQLQARTPPHKANLRQDYSKIKEAAIQAKKNDFLQEWVAEKAEATYFAVDGMYEGCASLQSWKKHKLR